MATAVLFDQDQYGKPLIAATPENLYAFGDLIRQTELLLLDLFSKGLLSGTTHTCLGQEFCQMAVVRALVHPRDAVLSNHRNHGHFLTYSGEFVGLVAEVMGREAGICQGVGGSQHIAYRHFHSNGVQAGMTAIGVGEALGRKRADDDSLVAVIVGDGTLGEGLLYEALNLSSIWQAPVLFVVEHNQVAQTTPTARTIGGSVAGRGAAFGLPTWELRDDDEDFFPEVQSVVDRVRASRSPGFLVIETRRLGPHSKGDDLRSEAEMEVIRRRDPLAAMGRRLAEDVRRDIQQANREFIAEVSAAANDSPPSRFEMRPTHVFMNASEPVGRPARGGSLPEAGNVRASINGALRRLLEASEKTLVLGEDLHDPYGGAFKVTQGLSTTFAERVISTPISEAGIVGAGIGLALSGYRPIVEVMFADFLTLAADQLYNHAVKFGAMFPDASVPLVVRAPSGGRRGYGPTHSQSPENLFTSVPGLTVLFASHRHDVGSLLEAAASRWDFPVLFLEHKLLYGETCAPGSFEAVPAEADDPGSGLFPTLRSGATAPDLTLVAYGGILPLVEKVAARLADEEELAVEIIVPALLAPLPRASLLRLLGARPRVAIVEESHAEFGVSAEIAATLAEAGFSGRLARIGAPPVPIPSARSLEVDVLPDEDLIVERLLDLF